MYTINFQFTQEGLEPIKIENVPAGQTLLETALIHDIELHHNCGGVCSCTTCHLYVEQGMEFIDERSTRERDFLQRVVDNKENSRLGCQSLLMEGKGEIRVTIPDQREIEDEYYLD